MFLDDANKKQTLHQDDDICCDFLHGMIQTYHQLASSNEPGIFDIKQEQKHILNQLIHFASKNWDGCKNWYWEHYQSAIKKSLSTRLVAILWKHLKLPAYSIDYISNICDKLKWTTQDDNAPLDVHKNNWLHLDKDLFSRNDEKLMSFVFLQAFSLLLIVFLDITLVKVNTSLQTKFNYLPITTLFQCFHTLVLITLHPHALHFALLLLVSQSVLLPVI